jgi:hypothetical protein
VFATAEDLPGHARAAHAWRVDTGAATGGTSSTVRAGE